MNISKNQLLTGLGVLAVIVFAFFAGSGGFGSTPEITEPEVVEEAPATAADDAAAEQADVIAQGAATATAQNAAVIEGCQWLWEWGGRYENIKGAFFLDHPRKHASLQAIDIVVGCYRADFTFTDDTLPTNKDTSSFSMVLGEPGNVTSSCTYTQQRDGFNVVLDCYVEFDEDGDSFCGSYWSADGDQFYFGGARNDAFAEACAP